VSVLCEIRDLSVTYFGDVDVKVIENLNMTIEEGEILGLAGESGCGKSTLAMALTRLLENGEISGGQILFRGQDLVRASEEELRKIRWSRISLVTQSAMSSLNPVLTIGEQIVDAIQAHTNTNTRDAWKRAEELLSIVEVDPGRVRSFPHELSGGMRQRVMIAMALALQPELIIMDEPTTALDVVVQKQVIRKIKELQAKFGFSVLFITHDMSLLLSIADRIAIMYAGRLVEIGTCQEIRTAPRHPYTKGLLNSFPSVFERRELSGIGGSPPSMVAPPNGCRFHERCTFAVERCRTEVPGARNLSATHTANCHLLEEGVMSG
jgi:peptide/nickel transport system ATP-binding protein